MGTPTTYLSYVLVICGPEQYASRQGIHLNNPDKWYLDDALQVSERDNFRYIFCHYDHDGSQYRISVDVLKALFEYATEWESFTVKIVDPRGGVNPNKFSGGI